MAGTVKKRGEAGAARNYITRTQAVKKLQLSLPDFRKLCIWKGIYPREPRSRKKANKSASASTTFYYVKDIQYLLHEPLVARFREQKVLEKKIARALGRGDVTDAQRLDRHAARPEATGRPRHTLDHVVRERYPTFADALRDLDDCLSMLFLFASLPATAAVPAKMIARCERLCLEFQHYLIVSHSLRKSFLSIKGIYYQATLQGEDVLWLVPYKFNQRVVGDIDFRIMGTFVEFYMTLLGFVNYRLYTALGLKYPPTFDQTKDDGAAELAAFSLERVHSLGGMEDEDKVPAAMEASKETVSESGPDPVVQAEVNKLVKSLKEEEGGVTPTTATTSPLDDDQPSDAIDKFEPAGPGGDILPQPAYSTSNPRALFAGCTVYLSRETPRASLELLLRAFGCRRIGWDAVLGAGAYTTDEKDPRITHQIVDRPPVVTETTVVVAPEATENGELGDNQTAQTLASSSAAAAAAAAGGRVPGRIYVQPQWVWDSINAEELQRADLYAPGAQLPPHLSPFVKAVQGQYDPSLPLEAQQTEAEALASDEEGDDDDDEEEDEDEVQVTKTKKGKTEESEAEDDSDGGMDVAESEDDDDEEEVAPKKKTKKVVEVEEVEDDDDDQDDSSDEAAASSAAQRQLELEAELTGKPVRAAAAAAATAAGANAAAAATASDRKAQAKADARKALARATRRQAEELERAKGMLPKKKRKLYEQMVYTNTKRSAEDEKLRQKRRKLERAAAKGKKE